MRSPKAVLYVARGIHVLPRRQHNMPTGVTRETRPKAFNAAQTSMIDTIFGEGAAGHAFAALTRKGTGTVLVDGGGDPVPLPHAVQVANHSARYATATATRRIEMEVLRCKQCAGPLTPHTVHHNFGTKPEPDQARTVEDCQRLSNFPVWAVHGYGASSPEEWWPYVSWFETWDGESYRDRDFCKDACAAEYGRRAARSLPLLPADGSRAVRENNPHERVRHYETEERIINGLRV